jgi:thymidylate kinase
MRRASLVIDGNDGIGKSTITSMLRQTYQEQGYNTLGVHFPQYDTHWGKTIKRLLSSGDGGLSLQERMVVYALNRLECVDTIKCELGKQDGDTILLFDRFPTSNILTIAYYLASTTLKDSSKIEILRWILAHEEEIEEHISLMYEIDAAFIKALGLEDTRVFIPAIDPEVSISRIETDANRHEPSDTYEKRQVQLIAYYLYSLAHKRQLLSIDIVEQGGRPANEIATQIVDSADITEGDTENPINRDIVVGENPNISPEIHSHMEQLIRRFPRLRRIDLNDEQ